jgi:hypothetical protein
VTFKDMILGPFFKAGCYSKIYSECDNFDF